MKASDFMKQLENDPEYQELIRKRNAKLKPIWDARKEDEENLVKELNECGFSIESVYDLVNNTPHAFLERRHIGSYTKAYPVLLKHLDIPHERIIRQGIIRSLTIKDGGKEVEETLLRHFENEEHPETKWCLANALKTAMPYHKRRKRPEIAHFYKTKTEQSSVGNAGKPRA
ncbi:MAG: hypothetical protein AAGJ81_15725 [Verrucomicrobiota bacterium]